LAPLRRALRGTVTAIAFVLANLLVHVIWVVAVVGAGTTAAVLLVLGGLLQTEAGPGRLIATGAFFLPFAWVVAFPASAATVALVGSSRSRGAERRGRPR
jgi:hypothetical protein